MAPGGDAENQANHNEYTSLLNDRQVDELPEQNEDEQKQVTEVSWYLWRIFWAVVGALVLGVFIKGWVDAGGDVEVGVLVVAQLFDRLTYIL
jgi:uncharacterized membrane protein YraQ (UPF0718 family)